jgi:anti-sigma factor RsiW
VWPSRPDHQRDRREPGRSLGSHLLKEALLQAYVDDLLNPHRRHEVEHSLSEHPREAARIRDFQSQNHELHELFDRYFAASTPANIEALQRHLVKTLRRQRRRQAYGWMAAAALFVIVVVGAVTVGPPPAPPIPWSFDDVVNGMRTDIAADMKADLDAAGFKPIGTRQISKEPDVTQHVFESATGRRIMLYESAAAPEDQKRVNFSQEGAVSVLFWTNKDRAFTLVGELDHNSVLQVVSAVSGEHQADGLRAIVAPDEGVRQPTPIR